MATSQISEQPLRPAIRWPSVIQLVLSILAVILLLGTAGIIVLYNTILYLTNPSGSANPTQSFMVAGSLAFIGVLVLPSAWYAWKDIAYPHKEIPPRPEPRGFGIILTIVVLVLVSGALILGNLIAQNNRLNWLLLPFLNIIATGLPALWIVYLGIRGLPSGPPKARWGVFATGLVVSSVIILIIEVILLIIGGVVALLWVSLDPSLSGQLQSLAIRIQNAGENPDALLRILVPFIVNPGIIFLIFAFVAVIIPMVEETLKPLGVWFLAGQKITSAKGFAFGVLCGAGYGLFENLGFTGGSSETWALMATTRISTLLLHSFTAGIMGWALAYAWSEKRYLRLGLAYAFAILVHGLWNGLAVLSAIPDLQGISNILIPPGIQQLGALAAIGLVALGAFILVFYIRMNAILRRSVASNTLALPGDGERLGQTGDEQQQIHVIETRITPDTNSSPDLIHPSEAANSSDTDNVSITSSENQP